MVYVLRELFGVKQETFNVANVVIGGLPGVNPALLVGSIFYLGDKLLLSPKGDFSRQHAKDVIEKAIDLANSYCLGFGLDVVFNTIESVEKILPFVAEYEIPLFLDSPDPGIRIKAYAMAKELGISSKCIANGVDVSTKKEELDAIKEAGIAATVIFAFDPRDPYASIMPENRIKIVKEKLLPTIYDNGLKNVIVDAIVIDPASIALSAETIFLVKKELGLPTGCAPANALGSVSKKNFSIEEVTGIHSSIAVMLRLYGADVIMYGPVKRIKYVASAIATIDGLLGYLARQARIEIQRKHPIRTLLKKIQKLFAQS